MQKENQGKDKKPNTQQEIPGRWDIELVDGVEVKDYVNIRTNRLLECASAADEQVATKIRAISSQIMNRRLKDTTGAMHGLPDPMEAYMWKMDRKRGLFLPQDYHIVTEEKKARSVSIMLVGDLSGSTSSQLNGHRKADYIVSSMHSFVKGLYGLPNMKLAYGFFNSHGRENIHFYEGMKFGEKLRYARTEPDHANRDGAIIRKAGKILTEQSTEVKIFMLINDSMPADSDEYNGKRGAEDVRHAITELKKAGIIPYVITVPPDSSYWKGGFETMEGYLNHIYIERKNWALINSVKDLDGAFNVFVKANLPKLRRVEII